MDSNAAKREKGKHLRLRRKVDCEDETDTRRVTVMASGRMISNIRICDFLTGAFLSKDFSDPAVVYGPPMERALPDLQTPKSTVPTF
jgi:hypothetical protein